VLRREVDIPAKVSSGSLTVTKQAKLRVLIASVGPEADLIAAPQREGEVPQRRPLSLDGIDYLELAEQSLLQVRGRKCRIMARVSKPCRVHDGQGWHG
jgi:hypothetical protein